LRPTRQIPTLGESAAERRARLAKVALQATAVQREAWLAKRQPEESPSPPARDTENEHGD
jgi:hypothetical protein